MATIDLNTVLSQFDDKGTLLQWLKKVDNQLKKFEIDYTISNVSFTLDGQTLTLSITQGENILISESVTIPVLTLATLKNLLEGSEYISVDENEDGTKILIELDETNVTDTPTSQSRELITSGGVYNLQMGIENYLEQLEAAKLDASKSAVASVGGLVTPTAAPTEKVLVGVGTGNEQVQVKIGENLELSGATSPYTLNAIGGGGGDSKVKFYNVTGAASGSTLTLPAGITGNTLRADFRAGYMVILSNDPAIMTNEKVASVPNDIDYDVWQIWHINNVGGVTVMLMTPFSTRKYCIFSGSSSSGAILTAS